MQKRDRVEIMFEGISGKFDAVMEFVHEIPEMKADIKELKSDLAELKSVAHSH